MIQGIFSETQSTVGLDNVGKERCRCLTQKYSHNVHIAIACSDINEAQTINEMTEIWLPLLAEEVPNAISFIVGTKCDLAQVVTEEDARELALNWNAGFFETSATSGQNTQELLAEIEIAAGEIVGKEPEVVIAEPVLLDLENDGKTIPQNQGCCG
jgi:GTPase SAR1 family protein